MSEQATIARPYAVAAFNVAKRQNDFDSWNRELLILTHLIQTPNIKCFIRNNTIGNAQKGRQLIKVFVDVWRKPFQNFCLLLAENNRLNYVVEIYKIFENLWHEQQGIVLVNVESATELSQEMRKHIETKVARHFPGYIEMLCRKKTKLLAGIVIRVKGKVIDLSLQRQLQLLKQQLEI